MPRDGALVLSDVRETDAVDRLRAVRPSRDLQRGAAHGTARRRQADRSAADARQLPEGALGQHPRPVPCRLLRTPVRQRLARAGRSCRCQLRARSTFRRLRLRRGDHALVEIGKQLGRIAVAIDLQEPSGIP